MMNIHVRLLMFHSMLYAILIAREFFFLMLLLYNSYKININNEVTQEKKTVELYLDLKIKSSGSRCKTN